MDNTSFFSGLSDIGEATGTIGYGSHVSVLVTSCTPSLDEIAVRLGGPGGSWETTALPMRKPLRLHRSPHTRIALRATELAFATMKYLNSSGAEADNIPPSECMVAMDLLTGMASTAAASTLNTIEMPGEGGTGPLLELSATSEAPGLVDGDEDGAQVLRVRFCWSIGEMLPCAPQETAAAAQSRGDMHGSGDVGSLSDADSSERTPRAASSLHGYGVATSLTVGEPSEEHPSSSGSVNPHETKKEHHAHSRPPLLAAHLVATRRDSVTEHEKNVEETALPSPSLDQAEELHRGGNSSGVEESAAASAAVSLEQDVLPITARAVAKEGAGLTIATEAAELERHSEAKVAVGDDDAMDGAKREFQPKEEEPLSTPSTGRALSFSGSSKSSPRRRRPPNYRRSIVHMHVAPVASSTVVQQEENEAGEVGCTENTPDNTICISDDDDEPVEASRPLTLKRDAAPLALVVEPTEMQLKSDMTTSVRQDMRNLDSSFEAASSPNLPIEASSPPSVRRPKPPQGCHETAAMLPSAVPQRPTSKNLFEGADGAALVVSVAVTSVSNTDDAADPHRIVTVDIEASPDASEFSKTHTSDDEVILAFRTLPALRGLAAHVPQVSNPVLLRLPCSSEAPAEQDVTAIGLLKLSAACTLSERVTEGGKACPASGVFTKLWRSTAEVPLNSLPPTASTQGSPWCHEVSFTGSLGDAVHTIWTFMTVSTYRDAMLNLQARTATSGHEPVLQMTVVDESPSAVAMASSALRLQPRETPTARLWVSGALSSPSPASSRRDGIVHRMVAVSPAQEVVQQMITVPIRDPVVFVAVKPSTSSPGAVATVHRIFTGTLSEAWTAVPVLTPPTEGTRASLETTTSSSSFKSIVLYYRVVASSTTSAWGGASSLPPPWRTHSQAPPVTAASSSPTLREFSFTVQPPTSCLTALPSGSVPPRKGTDESTTLRTTSAWTLLLRHSATHEKLAESNLSSGVMTYRGFLPFTSQEHPTSRGLSAPTSSVEFGVGNPQEPYPCCLPWEVLLIPSEDHEAAPDPGRIGCPMTSAARQRAPTSSGAPWKAVYSGAALILTALPLATTPSAGALWQTTLCIQAPPSSASAVLQSPSAVLGVRLGVSLAIRAHSLDSESAVFCLRSLRLSALPPQAAKVKRQPSCVQVWFTTSGGDAEDVRAAWADEVPSLKEVQHAWAPLSPSLRSDSAPPLYMDAAGELVATGVPLLLTTTNKRSRLCIAVSQGGEASAAEREGSAQEAPSMRNLRRSVAMARKRVIHRYTKALIPAIDAGDCGSYRDPGHYQTCSPKLSPEQVAEAFVQCVSAVAMHVDNYVEVDLRPSLAAASERQGQARRRLLLSSVSGVIRIHQNTLLEVQGQWIKMPRTVAEVPERYTPSPRLWGMRCSCIVRRQDTTALMPHSSTNVKKRVRLAQEILEAQTGYNVIVRSLPLNYTDPSEHTIQLRLPGLSFDQVVLRKKLADPGALLYRESICSGPPGARPTFPQRFRHRSSEEYNMIGDDDDNDGSFSQDTVEILEGLFGPTGIVHDAYISKRSRKVAVVHFLFGNAYTTRTALRVTCEAAAAPGEAKVAMMAVAPPRTPNFSRARPFPAKRSLHTKGASLPTRAVGTPSFSLQLLCDSLISSVTLSSFIPKEVLEQQFCSVSHSRYPPELTWYHGNLAIDRADEQQRREQGEIAWQSKLGEERFLGSLQKPGPLIVSSIVQHPFGCLPSVVEPSVTSWADGRYTLVFGGLSTTTGTTSSQVNAFDAVAQVWQSLVPQGTARALAAPAVPAAMPPPRYGHTALHHLGDDAVYVFGGRDFRMDPADCATGSAGSPHDAEIPVYGDVWQLNCDMDACTVAAMKLSCTWDDAPPARAGEGKSSSSSSSASGDLESVVGRWRHAAVLYDNYMVILGGQTGTGMCCSCVQLAYLDLKAHRWSLRRSYGSDAPSPRYGLAAAAISEGASLFVFGGCGINEMVASPVPIGSAADDNAKATSSEGDMIWLSDFYKMNLVTRVWCRVEPNGTVRPPALELADMAACTLDGCPVLLLVGGRVGTGAETVMPSPPSSSKAGQLQVFLFSTATQFWRLVKLDCTPIPTRFGLRVTVSAGGPTTSGREPSATGISRLRRSLPARGLTSGEIIVVGGLPPDEAAVVKTTPAVTVRLAARYDSGREGDGSHAASAVRAMSDGAPAPSAQHATQRPQTVPRALIPRRPVTCPSRASVRRSTSPTPPLGRLLTHSGGWLRKVQEKSNIDVESEYFSRAAGADFLQTQPAAPIRRSEAHSYHSVSTPVYGSPVRLFNPRHPSCYSTLAPRQQWRLVHRLYTVDLQERAARHQRRIDATNEVRFGSVSHLHRGYGSHTCGVSRTSGPMGASALPHRRSRGSASRFGVATSSKEECAERYNKTETTATEYLDLRSAFLVRESRSSSTTSCSRLTSSASESRCYNSDSWDARSAVESPKRSLALTSSDGHMEEAAADERKVVRPTEISDENSVTASSTGDAGAVTADRSSHSATVSDESESESESEASLNDPVADNSGATTYGDDEFESDASSDRPSSALPQHSTAASSEALSASLISCSAPSTKTDPAPLPAEEQPAKQEGETESDASGHLGSVESQAPSFRETAGSVAALMQGQEQQPPPPVSPPLLLPAAPSSGSSSPGTPTSPFSLGRGGGRAEEEDAEAMQAEPNTEASPPFTPVSCSSRKPSEKELHGNPWEKKGSVKNLEETPSIVSVSSAGTENHARPSDAADPAYATESGESTEDRGATVETDGMLPALSPANSSASIANAVAQPHPKGSTLGDTLVPAAASRDTYQAREREEEQVEGVIDKETQDEASVKSSPSSTLRRERASTPLEMTAAPPVPPAEPDLGELGESAPEEERLGGDEDWEALSNPREDEDILEEADEERYRALSESRPSVERAGSDEIEWEADQMPSPAPCEHAMPCSSISSVPSSRQLGAARSPSEVAAQYPSMETESNNKEDGGSEHQREVVVLQTMAEPTSLSTSRRSSSLPLNDLNAVVPLEPAERIEMATSPDNSNGDHGVPAIFTMPISPEDDGSHAVARAEDAAEEMFAEPSMEAHLVKMESDESDIENEATPFSPPEGSEDGHAMSSVPSGEIVHEVLTEGSAQDDFSVDALPDVAQLEETSAVEDEDADDHLPSKESDSVNRSSRATASSVVSLSGAVEPHEATARSSSFTSREDEDAMASLVDAIPQDSFDDSPHGLEYVGMPVPEAPAVVQETESLLSFDNRHNELDGLADSLNADAEASESEAVEEGEATPSDPSVSRRETEVTCDKTGERLSAPEEAGILVAEAEDIIAISAQPLSSPSVLSSHPEVGGEELAPVFVVPPSMGSSCSAQSADGHLEEVLVSDAAISASSSHSERGMLVEEEAAASTEPPRELCIPEEGISSITSHHGSQQEADGATRPTEMDLQTEEEGDACEAVQHRHSEMEATETDTPVPPSALPPPCTGASGKEERLPSSAETVHNVSEVPADAEVDAEAPSQPPLQPTAHDPSETSSDVDMDEEDSHSQQAAESSTAFSPPTSLPAQGPAEDVEKELNGMRFTEEASSSQPSSASSVTENDSDTEQQSFSSSEKFSSATPTHTKSSAASSAPAISVADDEEETISENEKEDEQSRDVEEEHADAERCSAGPDYEVPVPSSPAVERSLQGVSNIPSSATPANELMESSEATSRSQSAADKETSTSAERPELEEALPSAAPDEEEEEGMAEEVDTPPPSAGALESSTPMVSEDESNHLQVPLLMNLEAAAGTAKADLFAETTGFEQASALITADAVNGGPPNACPPAPPMAEVSAELSTHETSEVQPSEEESHRPMDEGLSTPAALLTKCSIEASSPLSPSPQGDVSVAGTDTERDAHSPLDQLDPAEHLVEHAGLGISVDLLNRRRGVEEEVQANDFDF